MKTVDPSMLLYHYQSMSDKDQKTFKENLAAYERGIELAKERRWKKKVKTGNKNRVSN